MNNFFSKFSIENFSKHIKEAFSRFPLSFVSSVLMFLILEFLVYNGDIITNYTENILLKSVLSLVTVYFLSFGIYLFAEKYSFSRLKTCLFQLFPVIFGILFYFSFEQDLFNNFFTEEFVYIIITFVGVISFVFVSSFIKNLLEKRIDNDKYYTFFNAISGKILMSVIVGFALTLLGFIALFSVFELFDLTQYIDEGKFYGYWIVFSLSLFAPIYFLSIAPEREGNMLLFDKIKDNKFYNFLSNYIALPFIIIYFFILYAYSIKVLSNFSDWPRGIISWMVIGFSLFGYLIYIFSYAFEQKSGLVRFFRKVFPFAVLFQTPMLFYAIYLRINQYDFTINRYLVVVFGIFLVLISLYFIFSNKKYLLHISLLLTIFIIIISIGPWGVYSFPESRQLNLLKPDLVESGILQGGLVVLPKDESDIEAKLSGRIYEKVSYLCGYHGCDSMIEIFPNLLEEIKVQDKADWEKNHEEEIKRLEEVINKYSGDESRTKVNQETLDRVKKQVYTGIYSWTYRSKLIEKLKVQPYYDGKLTTQGYISFTLNYEYRNRLIKISDYDYLIQVLGIGIIDQTRNGSSSYKDDLYYAKVDVDNENLIIYKEGIVFDEFDISSDFKKIYDENISNVSQFGNVELKEAFSFEKIGTSIDVKVIFDDFAIKNPVYGGTTDNYYNITGKVLIREK